MRFRLRQPRTRFAWAVAILAAWALVALAQSMQGYLVALYRGHPQPWWPTFGYAGAIYSVWLALTWPIVAATIAIERRLGRWWLRLAAWLALWPVTAALHVLIFGVVYWPVYRSPDVSTRWEMADIMFVRNFDTNSMLYASIVGLTILWCRWQARAPGRSESPPLDVDALVIRNRGSIRRIPLDAIDWIGAAGDYAEVHGSAGTHLIEESLTSLARRLPAASFARIHRSALIRLDRVREVAPIGRGDAHVRLASGERLRLSRRFRANLAPLLRPAQPAE